MRYINGESALKLGRELRSHWANPTQQIYFWWQLYLKAGVSALKPKPHDQKTKHKRKRPIDWSKFTREELIEVIKIYDKFINENKANKRRDKFQAVKNYRGVISIKKLCLVLDLNRSSYYWWLKNPPHSPYNATWLAQIRQLYYDYNAIFGVRRLHVHLQRDFKTHLNPKTVHRYMRHLGLKARIRTKKRACAAKRGWENLIKQQFVAKHPHQKLFTDVSYVRINNKWCYISVVIDGFNAQVIDYQLSWHNKATLVIKNVKQALKSTDQTPIIHSDHGVQYVSDPYRAMVKRGLFIPSMSRLGKCLDNRPAEYYFSILKQECLKQHNMAQLTFKQLQKIIADFTHFYNYDRTQSNLGNLTPIEFLISYQQQIKIAN